MVRRVRFLRVHFWFGHDQYWMGPDVTKKYLKVPRSTSKYLKVPRSTSKNPEVPQSSQKYLKIPQSTQKYLKSTQKYLSTIGSGLVRSGQVSSEQF